MEKDKLIDIENDFLEDNESIFVPTPQKAPLPLTTEELIVKQYKLGMTLKQITTENGLSYGKVYEILTRLGVALRHGRYNSTKSGDRILTMSSLEKSSLIADYLAGFHVKDMLERYSINKHGLYSILDEANVDRRQKSHTQAVNVGKVAKAMTTLRVEPTEEPIEAWTEGNMLRIVIRKSAFNQDVNELRLNFEFDLEDGTISANKEEK